MIERVTHQIATFAHQFSLAGLDGTFPPGDYDVEITEEQLPGLSFTAYRRVSTTIRLPGSLAAHPSWQLFEIEPDDLAAALTRDADMGLESNDKLA
jgi:hypothetical protein